MPAFIFSTYNLSLEFGRVAFPEIDGFITSRLVVDLAAPCDRGIMDTKGPLGKREGSDRTFSLPVTSHRELGIGSSHLIPSRPAVNSPSAGSVYSYVPGKPILLRFVPGEGTLLYHAPHKHYGAFKECVTIITSSTLLSMIPGFTCRAGAGTRGWSNMLTDGSGSAGICVCLTSRGDIGVVLVRWSRRCVSLTRRALLASFHLWYIRPSGL